MSDDTLVLKFGGTSLASPLRVRRAAARIRAHLSHGRRVVVVVSAAGHETDRLLARIEAVAGWEGRHATTFPGECGHGRRAELESGLESGRGYECEHLHEHRYGHGQNRGHEHEDRCGLQREVDRLLATGEDRSATLLALALCALGIPARSLRGGEAGIGAVGEFGAGTIERVVPAALQRLLERGVVPVISGFQGERDDGETVTLGRGGSDISAIALAAALGPVPCHIVTDVAAVYDSDPRTTPAARPYAAMDHDELVALTEAGAAVVHPRAARLAATYQVPLRIYSFRAPWQGGGTRIGDGAGVVGQTRVFDQAGVADASRAGDEFGAGGGIRVGGEVGCGGSALRVAHAAQVPAQNQGRNTR